MSDEKKKLNKENQFLADLDAYRTGEEQDIFSNDHSMNPVGKQAFNDLEKISNLFSRARPDSGEIPEKIDNAVLGHIRQKSREIRRDRKVVRLFPRYKWATAAVMGVLVCVVSFKLVYKMDKPADKSFKEDITQRLAEFRKEIDEMNEKSVVHKKPGKATLVSDKSIQADQVIKKVSVVSHKNIVQGENKPVAEQIIATDVDGNGKVNIIDAYIMDRRLMSGVAMPETLDLNGDGNINQEDINNIIKTAVSLEGGEV